MVSNIQQCPSCLAHYTGEHTCDGLMKRMVEKSNVPVYTQQHTSNYTEHGDANAGCIARLRKELEHRCGTCGLFDAYDEDDHGADGYCLYVVILPACLAHYATRLGRGKLDMDRGQGVDCVCWKPIEEPADGKDDA